MSKPLQDAARSIFSSALRAIDVRAAVRGEVIRTGDVLTLAGRPLTLAEVDYLQVIAVGKAAVPMYMAAAEAIGDFAHRAIVVAPLATLPRLEDDRSPAIGDAWSSATFLPGAHPTPTSDSLQAADVILGTLAAVTSRTAVLFLVSGGASAMVERPLDPSVTLDDLAAFSRALVASSMDITEMNAIRKHMSAVKGGRLAHAAQAARMQCTLLISDVPEAAPDAIGSGPSLPDRTTLEQALHLFSFLRKSAALPANIVQCFEGAGLPESPKASDAAFSRSHWKVVLSSGHLADAARAAAQASGFHAVVDNSCDDMDYREAGAYLIKRGFALAAETTKAICLISVGEVGVTVSNDSGEGGRNQQFALLCAETLVAQGLSATVLSAGSDGIDGHSSAAGAVCDESTPQRAAVAGFSVRAALAGFDTTPLLNAVGDAVYTGPTGNNLRDLRLVLIAPTDGLRGSPLR